MTTTDMPGELRHTLSDIEELKYIVPALESRHGKLHQL